MKYFFIIGIFSLLFIFSCGNNELSDTEDAEDLSPQEVFSLTLTEDILGEEDEDLKTYLEEFIYPLVSKSSKVSIDKITSSQYLLVYYENDTAKGLLLQKFYNPATDEIEFTKAEKTLTK